MTMAQSLAQLPPKSPADILGMLQQHRPRPGDAGATPLPVLTVMLASGATLRGEFLNYANDRHGATLMMQTGVGAGAADVIYLPLGAVHGLIVHTSKENVHLLGFGALNPQASGKVPGRLDLERQIQDWSGRMEKDHGLTITFAIAWDQVPGDDQPRHTLSRFIIALQKALDQLAADSMGKEALKSSVPMVAIVRGEAAEIAKTPQGLNVTFAPTTGDVRLPDSMGLLQTLESIL